MIIYLEIPQLLYHDRTGKSRQVRCVEFTGQVFNQKHQLMGEHPDVIRGVLVSNQSDTIIHRR